MVNHHCRTIAGMPEVPRRRSREPGQEKSTTPPRQTRFGTQSGGRDNRLLGGEGEGAVPEDGAAQTFMEVDLGFVGEGGAGQRDVGERVGDVSGAGGRVFDWAGVTGEFAEACDGIVEGDALGGGDVEDAARNIFGRSLDGAEVGVHDIFDVGEVAALGTVSVDDGGAARSMARENLARTPEYCEEGSWWGPKTLK